MAKTKQEYNSYMRQYMLNRYHDRMSQAKELLGNQCNSCATTIDLEFDHIDSTNKTFTIAKLWSLAEETFLKEIKKCQLLCKPCHKIKTVQFKETGGGHNKIKNPKHGTAIMYGREKCRCFDCCLWKKMYRAGDVNSQGRDVF